MQNGASVETPFCLDIRSGDRLPPILPAETRSTVTRKLPLSLCNHRSIQCSREMVVASRGYSAFQGKAMETSFFSVLPGHDLAYNEVVKPARRWAFSYYYLYRWLPLLHPQQAMLIQVLRQSTWQNGRPTGRCQLANATLCRHGVVGKQSQNAAGGTGAPAG